MSFPNDRAPGGNLEEQVRRMLLNNNAVSVDGAKQSSYPPIRLPPPVAPQSSQPHQAQPPNDTSRVSSQHRGDRHGGPQSHRQRTGHPPVPAPRESRNQSEQQDAFRQPHQAVYGQSHGPRGSTMSQQRGRFQQHMQLDPNAFHRGGLGRGAMNYGARPRHLYEPHHLQHHTVYAPPDQFARQAHYLEHIAANEVRAVDMSGTERAEKESFHLCLQRICDEVSSADPARFPQISLECFGSFVSGFATAGSDMDLVIVLKGEESNAAQISLLEDDLPRVLEDRLLQSGIGARLLTRTRVPIIKVCQSPELGFLHKLQQERQNWNVLPHEAKYPHLCSNEEELEPESSVSALFQKSAATQVGQTLDAEQLPALASGEENTSGLNGDLNSEAVKDEKPPTTTCNGEKAPQTLDQAATSTNRPRNTAKIWTRERKAGPLEFPKSGVGIQSDINFFNPLGLHNTQMLRCYSLCDPRVRLMVLFVKAWAKRRKINSSYSGTLSSYGYVLMVLHYLINIASPPVLPNLQSPTRPPGFSGPLVANTEHIDGWDVTFWRDEKQIMQAAQRGLITANRDPLGALLAGFFHYYSSQGAQPQFIWMQQVLSLRTAGGLLLKEDKGWVKAVTEEGEGRKVQNRYLFCIEDPFELDHNVARTVTHNGIVAIRDEFRRARRILHAVGNGWNPRDGELFAQLVEAEDGQKMTEDLAANASRDRPAETVVNSRHDAQMEHQNGPRKETSTPSSGSLHLAQRSPRTNLPAPKAKALDVHDSDAFPTLGTPKSGKVKHSHQRQPSENWSEISGTKAKAFLEEVKRKKDEAQAESTAMGAAEAVLGDESDGFDEK